jgi:hypothetical protein
MRREEHVDYFLVKDEHVAIHARLEAWARWVKVRPFGWQTAPMFRQAKSNSFQWHAPQPRTEHNIPEAVETEKAVSLLPVKEREALRWCYVAPTHPRSTARRLAVSLEGLRDLVERGRIMLINRL